MKNRLQALLRAYEQAVGIKGMLPQTPGNIDIYNRPIHRNPDGSISTVRSISVTGDRGRATLLPTISPQGALWSNPEAVANYRRTGQNLGTFDNEARANLYAQWLHNQQAGFYKQKAGRGQQRRLV